MTTVDLDGLHLDGNAAAGLLSEIFPFEMSVAWSTCAHCGAAGQVGEVLVYLRAPGVVFRCPACGEVLMRLVRLPGGYWLDLGGVRSIRLLEE